MRTKNTRSRSGIYSNGKRVYLLHPNDSYPVSLNLILEHTDVGLLQDIYVNSTLKADNNSWRAPMLIPGIDTYEGVVESVAVELLVEKMSQEEQEAWSKEGFWGAYRLLRYAVGCWKGAEGFGTENRVAVVREYHDSGVILAVSFGYLEATGEVLGDRKIYRLTDKGLRMIGVID